MTSRALGLWGVPLSVREAAMECSVLAASVRACTRGSWRQASTVDCVRVREESYVPGVRK